MAHAEDNSITPLVRHYCILGLKSVLSLYGFEIEDETDLNINLDEASCIFEPSLCALSWFVYGLEQAAQAKERFAPVTTVS